MTQQGFNEYLHTVYGYQTGTAKSYITAINIIDELFKYDDVFHLKGKSIITISDFELLSRIEEFIRAQQSLYKKGENSFFKNININQRSYPGRGFCSAAIKQLLEYYIITHLKKSMESIERKA